MPEIRPSYGNAWQEFRAWVVSVLFSWSLSIHRQATFDMARGLAEIEARAPGQEKPCR